MIYMNAEKMLRHVYCPQKPLKVLEVFVDQDYVCQWKFHLKRAAKVTSVATNFPELTAVFCYFWNSLVRYNWIRVRITCVKLRDLVLFGRLISEQLPAVELVSKRLTFLVIGGQMVVLRVLQAVFPC